MFKEKIAPAVQKTGQLTAPKFKGKTKIELFENGKKVGEHIDNNMMTNMLSKVYNPKRLCVDRKQGNEVYKNLTPIYSTALGGLLLYAEAIEENAELSFAPMSNRCVAHAGSAYSGTQATRGTLNETESGFIKPDEPWQGYRYVWDFATDKANGVISCACLTSRTGGNSGYGKGIDYAIAESNNAFAADLTNLSSSATASGITFQIVNTSSLYGGDDSLRYLGESDDGFSRFVYLSSSTQLVLVELPVEELKLNLADEIDASGRVIDFNSLGKDTPTYRINQYDLPFTVNYFSCDVRDGVYYLVSHTNSTEFAFTAFNPDTKAFTAVQNRVVSPAYDYTNYNKVCFAGGYWFAQGSDRSTVYRYPEEGGTGEAVGTVPATYGNYQEFNGNLAWVSLSSTSYLKIFNSENPEDCFSKTHSGPYMHGIEQMFDDGVILELNATSSSDYNDINFTVSACRLTGYLATINNLQTPITKTSAQTMKITYEITPTEIEEVTE